MASTAWVRQLTSSSNATVRLLCFPYAGGGATVFLDLARACPDWTAVHAVEYPGRGSRLREAPAESVADLAMAAAPALASLLDRPFAVLGYSFGALVAFEWVRRLEAAGGPSPLTLFICARQAPQHPGKMPPIHQLPDDEFIEAMQERYNGIPLEVLSDPELVALFLPALRADIRASETYGYREAPLLSCRIHAFCGLRDPTTSSSGVQAWCEQTRAPFGLQWFPAGHFFLRAHGAEMAASIAGMLSRS